VNCISDIASPPTGVTGGKTYANQFQNTVDATRDFRLKAGADCINAGTTDTTDIPAAVDIVGTSRPQGSAWDVGCWELVLSVVKTGQVFSLLKNVGKNTVNLTSPEALALSRLAVRMLLLVDPQAVVLVPTKGGGGTNFQNLFATLAEGMNLSRASGKNLTSLQGQSVSILRSMTRFLTLSIVENVTLLKSKLQALSLSVTERALLSRSTARTLSFQVVESMRLSRAALKTASVSVAQVAALARSIGRNLSLATAEAAALTATKGAKNFSQSLAAVVAQRVSLMRLTGKGTIVAQAQQFVLTRGITHKISLSESEVVSLARTRGHLQAPSLSTASKVLLTAVQGAKNFSQSLVAATAQRVLLAHSTLKQQALTLLQAASLVRSTAKSLSWASGERVVLITGRLTFRAMTLTQVQKAALQRVIGKVSTFVVAQSPALTRSVAKTLFLGSGQNLSLAQRTARRMLVGVSQVVILAQRPTRRMLVGVGQTVMLTRSTTKSLVAVIGEMVVVSKRLFRLLLLGTTDVASINAFRPGNLQLRLSQSQLVTQVRSIAKAVFFSQPSLVGLVTTVFHRVRITVRDFAAFFSAAADRGLAAPARGSSNDQAEFSARNEDE
jgi:hypothetical protein